MSVEDPAVLSAEAEERRRVLVVDDEKAVRYLCSEALQDYRVTQAGNGREALQVLAREKVDVLLTDVVMPEMGGLELLRTVKDKEPNRVVVVMTSFGDRETVMQALKAGADDFIDKPIDLLQVRSAVDRAVEKNRLREELIRLKQLDQFKTDFLGLVSHKLKTPITIISLALQMLQDKEKKKYDPDFWKRIDTIQKQTYSLEALVEGLLCFSDVILQEDKLKLERTDPGELAVRCVEELKESASLRGIEMTCRIDEALPEMPLDRKRLHFAMHAVLDNAVKFNAEGGSVTVSAAAGDDGVRIAVRDTGAGIPPDEQPKVFEKFYQVDPDYTGQVPGFGLGLFYAQQFVRDHGGRLELESEPGEGTTVSIVLPFPGEEPPQQR